MMDFHFSSIDMLGIGQLCSIVENEHIVFIDYEIRDDVSFIELRISSCFWKECHEENSEEKTL